MISSESASVAGFLPFLPSFPGDTRITAHAGAKKKEV